ncbi:hypothetical protein D3C76_1428460 [compost metagenome]
MSASRDDLKKQDLIAVAHLLKSPLLTRQDLLVECQRHARFSLLQLVKQCGDG